MHVTRGSQLSNGSNTQGANARGCDELLHNPVCLDTAGHHVSRTLHILHTKKLISLIFILKYLLLTTKTKCKVLTNFIISILSKIEIVLISMGLDSNIVITARVRSTTGRYCFHRCLSVHGGGGGVRVPPGGSGYPPRGT